MKRFETLIEDTREIKKIVNKVAFNKEKVTGIDQNYM